MGCRAMGASWLIFVVYHCACEPTHASKFVTTELRATSCIRCLWCVFGLFLLSELSVIYAAQYTQRFIDLGFEEVQFLVDVDQKDLVKMGMSREEIARIMDGVSKLQS
eukprot:m.258032 g.258032  ORF g.258032 m.258032 type:complete len:108 (+) comp19641_c0_seq2:3166-3489(+)